MEALPDGLTESSAKVVKPNIHRLWHFFVLVFEDKGNSLSNCHMLTG